jgi:hypothetical protein
VTFSNDAAPPRPAGKIAGDAGRAISGRLSSSSNRRSEAPAARCMSAMNSEMAPKALATTMA